METVTVKVVFIGADLQVADMVGLSIRLRWSGVTPLVATTTSDGLFHVVGHQGHVKKSGVLHGIFTLRSIVVVALMVTIGSLVRSVPPRIRRLMGVARLPSPRQRSARWRPTESLARS